MIHLWVGVCGIQMLAALKYLKALSSYLDAAYAQIIAYDGAETAFKTFHYCKMILLIIL